MTLDDALHEMPVVAILRGMTPSEAVAIGDALLSAGIRVLEVPMNSPDPFKSIALLARAFQGRLVVGAGTVVDPAWIDQIRSVGGTMIVAPNTDSEVIRKSLKCGLEPIPGFATATEAFTAKRAGARFLKLFPATSLGISHFKALNAVLPADAFVLAVGGVAAANVEEWFVAGAKGFGIGSEIYRPGQSADETFRQAMNIVSAVRRVSRAN